MKAKKLIDFTLSLIASISFLYSGSIEASAASESSDIYAFVETFDVKTKASLDTGYSYINAER